MTRVLLEPHYSQIEENHGIGRIIHAQYKYLPKHDIEFVRDPDLADVIAGHTQQYQLPRIDVLHCHGIYWTGEPGSGYYERWHWKANEKIMDAARRALYVTVPSAWVSEPFKRDMRILPRVIGHGIDFSDWPMGEPKNYVLWNKNRAADVCDPTPAWELAEHGVQVISTFAPFDKPPNEYMTIVGQQSHEQMKLLVQHASIYLATVKETYGIGTLEAMACGVPVLGYRHGGTADIVRHKETGYLVEPGNTEDLLAGVNYILQHRAELSANAREYASTRDWQHVIHEYAALYHECKEHRQHESTKVSIVVTNYNYAQYVGEAIESALAQTVPCEVVVVDDGSTDGSRDRIRQFGNKIRTIFQPNAGVAAARNRGIREATGEFIVCLDADDRLDRQYAEICQKQLISDRGLGVVYTGLGLITEREGIVPKPWPPAFSWEGMCVPHNPPNNCIPCAAMFRKEMWRRAGGYRQEYAPGEDTEFWLRGLSSGFGALKATDDYLFHYRPHAGGASRVKQYIAIDSFKPWMRDKLYPMAVPAVSAPPIRSYSTPKVSVIIPVGPGHEKFVTQAIESLLGQSMRDWEVIVVWDTTQSLGVLKSYPFVKEQFLPPADKHGSGAARNAGLQAATAPLVLFLDADDFLMPDTLQKMMVKYSSSEGRYVYTDWIRLEGDKTGAMAVANYDPIRELEIQTHLITVLMATESARQIQFDESLSRLEDWDFFIRCAINGIHGVRLAEPLVACRIHAERKTADLRQEDKLRVYLRYEDYRKGDKSMAACCGGGDSVGAILAAKAALFPVPPAAPELPAGIKTEEVVRMEFIGEERGAMTFGGPGTTPSGKRYRGGANPFNKFIDADPRDVAWLEHSGKFSRRRQLVEAAPANPEIVAETLVRIQAQDIVIDVEEPKEALPDSKAPAPAPNQAVDMAEAPVQSQGTQTVGRKRGRPRKSAQGTDDVRLGNVGDVSNGT
jgi:glycosyltransferase involved in cell wall biosynthesis